MTATAAVRTAAVTNPPHLRPRRKAGIRSEESGKPKYKPMDNFGFLKVAAAMPHVRVGDCDFNTERIAAMAADVAEHPDAGATALRESKYAWAGQLRAGGRKAEAVKLYKELASEVKTRQGAEAAYYVIESLFEGGDLDATEKAVFAFSEREPDSYWLAKAFILLGDVYVRKGDNFQARATYQSVADGYTPADDGIVDEAKARIAKLN